MKIITKAPEETIKRIEQMEERYDLLWEALGKDPDFLEKDGELKQTFDTLIHYYTGGQWLRDYELDEKGLLPGDLKRGVLSQDGIYNLLSELMKE